MHPHLNLTSNTLSAVYSLLSTTLSAKLRLDILLLVKVIFDPIMDHFSSLYILEV